MDYRLDILISVMVVGSILFGWIREFGWINNVKFYPLGFISLIAVGLGFYLWLKYGLILDYGTKLEDDKNHATQMNSLGLILMIAAGISSIVLVGRYIIKKPLHNRKK